VRAALCTDAATAAAARKWNDANVLVMGLRLTSSELAREMLVAWFSTKTDPDEAANIARLEEPVATPVDATPADAPEKTPSRPRAEERT
jgi:ribose 5-phosphate isomerase B